MQYKVNLHLTELCNYRCKYCFAKYVGHDMGFSEWKTVIDNLVDSHMVSAVNLAGGEPLLYKDFAKILDYAYGKGLKVSFITNGSLLGYTNRFVPEDTVKIFCIGISIDSFDADVCKTIGRYIGNGMILDIAVLGRFLAKCRQRNPELSIKVNTVVSEWNKDEPLAEIINRFGWDYGWGVDKWKLLRAMPFGGDSSYCLTDAEFSLYVLAARSACCRNRSLRIISEDTLENAYVIVDNRGNLISNIGGVNVSCGSLLEKPFGELIKNYPLDIKRYMEHL